MVQPIRKEQVKQLLGRDIFAVKKDGTVVTGKLVKIQGTKLIVNPPKGKKVQTKAVIPLVLFDLLAIGAYGGYGPYGYGPGYGYGPIYGPGSGVGYPGLFW